MKKSLLIVSLMSVALGMAAQDSTVFTYADAYAENELWGTSKKETYNVAISLADPSLAGAEITAINVPIVSNAGITDIKVWLTSELGIELVNNKNVNKADIASYDVDAPEAVENAAYTMINYQLEKPVVIPENGLYAGYSFTVSDVNDATKTPVVLSKTVDESGLYLYCSRSIRSWMSYSETAGGVSLMSVDISTVIPANGVGVVSLKNTVATAGEPSTTNMVVSNLGASVVNSVEYTVTVDGTVSETKELVLAQPIPASYAARGTLQVEIPAIEESGAHQVTVTIDKVNGEANEIDRNTASAIVSVMGFIPEYRPLIEEFTGTGCGWCPRGYAAMEYMKDKYPTEFMGLAWHKYNASDPMYVTDYPSLVSGFPGCVVNRQADIDPYFAMSNTDFGMEDYWLDLCKNTVSPVAVDVEVDLDKDAQTVKAVATINWQAVPEVEGDYRVEFLLSGDGFGGEGSEWNQANNYNNRDQDLFLVGEMFYGAGSSVNLTYNDVGMATSGFGGIEGSIGEIEVNAPKDVEYTFDLTKMVNGSGSPMAYTDDKLMVTAVVVLYKSANSNVVINSNRAWTSGTPNSITGIDQDNTVVATEYYDLSGRKLVNPEGLVIRVDRYNNGTVKSYKGFVRK